MGGLGPGVLKGQAGGSLVTPFGGWPSGARGTHGKTEAGPEQGGPMPVAAPTTARVHWLPGDKKGPRLVLQLEEFGLDVGGTSQQ